MKVAVSIPDPLFKNAEALARKLKKPRSRLYAEAVREYLDAHNPQAITEQINAVLTKADSLIDPILEPLQFESLDPNDTW
jgi:metal-responsive CopG/Arc/MetJ family transcriptional regulator